MTSRLSPQRQARLERMAALAVDAERRLLYPAEVLVIQWAGETGWGDKVSAPNNLFGVKFVRGRHRDSQLMWTPEEVTWAQLQRFPTEERSTAMFAESRLPVTGPYAGDQKLIMRCRFAAYATAQEGIDDQVRLITREPLYGPAWQAYQRTRDWRAFLQGIAAAGYASDAGYAKLLTDLSNTREIHAAIAAARAQPRTISQ